MKLLVTRSYPKLPWNDAFWNVSRQKSLRHLRGVGDRDRTTRLLLCIDGAIKLIRVIFATLFFDFLKIKCKEVSFKKRWASSDSDSVMDAAVAPAGEWPSLKRHLSPQAKTISLNIHSYSSNVINIVCQHCQYHQYP